MPKFKTITVEWRACVKTITTAITLLGDAAEELAEAYEVEDEQGKAVSDCLVNAMRQAELSIDRLSR